MLTNELWIVWIYVWLLKVLWLPVSAWDIQLDGVEFNMLILQKVQQHKYYNGEGCASHLVTDIEYKLSQNKGVTIC